MVLELQFKIKNNPMYTRYLRENSYWYKYLNRDPSVFKAFEEDAKAYFKVRTSDKLENFANNIGMLQTFMEMMN